MPRRVSASLPASAASRALTSSSRSFFMVSSCACISTIFGSSGVGMSEMRRRAEAKSSGVPWIVNSFSERFSSVFSPT